MPSPSQLVYVISDLHLGGEPGQAGQRGFRMCTQGEALAAFIDTLAGTASSTNSVELVINGDFVDFLAERASGEDKFTALKENPELARQIFAQIVDNNRAVFAALSRFVKAGHTLTVLLGNHDIELSFPVVRAALCKSLGVPPSYALRFLHDGEAHIVGGALIEHGNRYDAWNVVDHDALRRLLSLQSRRQAAPEDLRLLAPPGSQLVAEVMNPIKRDYPFVDLLKPESTAAVPLLLALDPGIRGNVGKLARLALTARQYGLRSAALPQRSGDIAATAARNDFGGMRGDMAARSGGPPPSRGADDAALSTMLDEALGPGGGAGFLRALDAGVPPTLDHSVLRGDIASQGPDRGGALHGALSLLRLVTSRASADLESRLPALRSALQAFCDPAYFHLDYRNEKDPYLRAATELAEKGLFSHIIFGHTHLARSLPLGGPEIKDELRSRYLNSGTWADLIRVPDDVFASDAATSTGALREMATALGEGRLDGLIWRRPTYVRLALADGVVSEASVEEYRGGHGAL